MIPSVKALALGVATLALSVNSSVISSDFHSNFKRDPPTAIPSCATDAEKRWQPAMDFDKDSCYNTPAIDAEGNLATGLKCEGSKSEGCRDESDLDNNNVYSRARCNNGWCGFLYGYYFEKDQAMNGSCGVGHTNDWEHVIVWVKNRDGMPSFVGVSKHGKYYVQRAEKVRFQDTHAKIVYHQEGNGTHNMRFATEADDDAIENHKGVWFFGDLIGYDGFPGREMADKVFLHDWGKAVPDMGGARFEDQLQKAKGGHLIPTDTWRDDGRTRKPHNCAMP